MGLTLSAAPARQAAAMLTVLMLGSSFAATGSAPSTTASSTVAAAASATQPGRSEVEIRCTGRGCPIKPKVATTAWVDVAPT
jgi:hypothetical protein